MDKKTSFLLMLLLGGCSMVPDFMRPEVASVDTWKNGAVALPEKTIASDWWKDYGSANLTGYVSEALATNNDLQASLQRVEQARASVRGAGAPLLPQISASGSGSKNYTEMNGNVTNSESSRAGVSISYELDLFSKNRAGVEAAEARLGASQFDHEALAIVVAGDVVQAYANAAASTERLQVARNNLEIAKDILGIINARFREGAASALEASQQKAEVASSEASMASLVRDHESYVNQLAVLTGKAPQGFTLKEDKLASLRVPAVTPVLPSRLLEQRPDIRSAEANLIAANADIGAARAAFFPSINLGIEGALTGNPAASLLSLSAGLLAPIFSGGTLEAGLQTSEARKMELVATYRQTVLNAFREVSDALAAVRAANTRVAALDTAQKEARTAYRLARARYDSGSIDFQALLDTQRSLLGAEDSYTQARLEQINASVVLIKAMGGGWTNTPQTSIAPATATPLAFTPAGTGTIQ
jgi:multidrug efflux system outer membrane protein